MVILRPIVFMAICFATFASTLSAQTLRERYTPEVGKLHPEFVLPNIQSGELTKLSSFRGKKTLLLHFASW